MDSSEPPDKPYTEIKVRAFASGSQSRSIDAGPRKDKASSPGAIGAIRFMLGLALLGAVVLAEKTAAAPGGAAPAAPSPEWPFPGEVVFAILAMILLVAVLAAAGAALEGVRRTRLQQLAAEGVSGARPAQRLLEDPSRFLATIQVGITLASMFAAAIAARAPAEYLARWLSLLARERGLESLAAHAFGLSLVLIILLVGFLELLLGQIIPKQLAQQYAERLALRVAGPVEALAAIASPLVRVLTASADAAARLFGAHARPAAPISEEEIKTIVEESEKDGVLEEQETEMIHSVLEFTDIVVREVMVPRIDMVCVDATSSIDELLSVVLESGHTRIPVYAETVDNIVGIVHAKDLLRFVRDGTRGIDIRSANILRPVYYVPENMNVDDLLAEFQRTKHQMAIVVDEYGGTSGLVTLEDLLEEIVGPITDEYDVEQEPSLRMVDENTAICDARMPIDDVNEALGIRMPEDESETVGGFVFSLIGKIPAVGDTVEYDGMQIEVLEADSRRVTKVKISHKPAPAEEATTGNGLE